MLIAQCRIKFGGCLEVYGVDVPTVEVLENSFLVFVLVRGHLRKPLLVAWQNATSRGLRVIEKVLLSRIGKVGSEPGAKGQESFEVGRVFLRGDDVDDHGPKLTKYFLTACWTFPTSQRSLTSQATTRTLWTASWGLRRTPGQTVRPGIHRSGDSTSRRDGLTSTVSLLVVLAVKAEERCHTLTNAGRDLNQLRRRNLTNRWRRPQGMRNRH